MINSSFSPTPQTSPLHRQNQPQIAQKPPTPTTQTQTKTSEVAQQVFTKKQAETQRNQELLSPEQMKAKFSQVDPTMTSERASELGKLGLSSEEIGTKIAGSTRQPVDVQEQQKALTEIREKYHLSPSIASIPDHVDSAWKDYTPVESKSRFTRFMDMISQKWNVLFGNTGPLDKDASIIKQMMDRVTQIDGKEDDGFVEVIEDHELNARNRFNSHLEQGEQMVGDGLAANQLEPEGLKIAQAKLNEAQQALEQAKSIELSGTAKTSKPEKLEALQTQINTLAEAIKHCQTFNALATGCHQIAEKGLHSTDVNIIRNKIAATLKGLAKVKASKINLPRSVDTTATKITTALEHQIDRLQEHLSQISLEGVAPMLKRAELESFDHDLEQGLVKNIAPNLNPESIQGCEQELSQLKMTHARLEQALQALDPSEQTDRKPKLQQLNTNIETFEKHIRNIQTFNQAAQDTDRILEEGLNTTDIDTIRDKIEAASNKLNDIKESKNFLPGSVDTAATQVITELEDKLTRLQKHLELKLPPQESTLAQDMASHNVVQEAQDEQEAQEATAAKKQQKKAGEELVSAVTEKAAELASRAIQQVGGAGDQAVQALASSSEPQTGSTTTLPEPDLSPVDTLINNGRELIGEGISKLNGATASIRREGEALIQRGLEQMSQVQAVLADQLRGVPDLAQEKRQEFEEKTGIKISRNDESIVFTRGDENGDHQQLTLNQDGVDLVIKQGDYLINGTGEQLTITHGNPDGDHQVITVSNDKAGFTFTQGDTTGTFGIEGDQRSGKASGEVSIDKIRGSDWGATMGARIEWRSEDKVLSDSRTMHTRAKGFQASVSASGSVGAVGITVGVGGGYSSNTIFLRTVRPDETAQAVCAQYQSDTAMIPTEDTMIQGPADILEKPGDTVIFSRNMNLHASVGVEGFGAKIEVKAEGNREMRMGIQRVEGDLPTFRVRMEPDTSSQSLSVSAGWGPFSVTGTGGTSSAVFYEFEMSESQVQDLMRTGELPQIPDPKAYLVDGKAIDADTFKTFDRLNANGIKLVSFGATQGTNLAVKADVTVATAGYERGKVNKVSFSRDLAQLESSRTQTTTTDAWFRGQQAKQIGCDSKVAIKPDKQGQLVGTYEGLRASFKLSDSDTSRDALEERLSEANKLLGRNHQNKLTLPQAGENFGQTETLVAVDIKPDQIRTLADLKTGRHHKASERNIQAVAYSTDIEPEKMTALIHQLQPEQIMAEHADRLSPSELQKTHMSQEEKILELQGEKLKEFVETHGLKGIAALDRLLGGHSAHFSTHTDLYENQLREIGVDQFEPTFKDDKAWNEFGQMATKQQKLKALKASLEQEGNRLITDEEKSSLMNKIEAQSQHLDRSLDRLLTDPDRRKTVMDAMISGSSSSAVMTMIRNAIADKFDFVDHSVHIQSNEELGGYLQQFMQRTIIEGEAGAVDAVRARGAREEVAGYLNQMLSVEGEATIEQLMGVFKHAQTDGSFSQLLELVENEKLTDMIPRLDTDQKQTLENLLRGTSGEKKELLINAMAEDNEKLQQQVNALNSKIEGLTQVLGDKIDTADKTGKELSDAYKPAMRNKRTLMEIKAEIQLNARLSKADRTKLLEACKTCETELNARMDLNALTSQQRTALFDKLMHPEGWFESSGRASHALMNDLIKRDSANAEQLTTYLPHLLSNIEQEKGQILNVLQLIEQADSSKLPDAFALISPEQLETMATTSKANLLAGKLKESRDSLVEQISEQAKGQLQSNVGDPLMEALKQQGIDPTQATELMKQQLAQMAPEALQDQVETTVDEQLEAGLKKVETAVSEPFNEQIGKALDKTIANLGGTPGVSRDTLLKMAIAVGDTTKAQKLRELNEDYQAVDQSLQEVESQLSGVTADQSTSYFKSMAKIGRDLVKTEAELQSKLSDQTDYRAPLQERVDAVNDKVDTYDHQLKQLSTQKRLEILNELAAPGFFKSMWTSDDGSTELIQDLIHIAKENGELSQTMAVLLQDPGNHANTLFGILKDQDRPFLQNIPTDKLTAIASQLSPDKQSRLLVQMGAEDYQTLSQDEKAKIDQVRQESSSAYVQAVEQFKAISPLEQRYLARIPTASEQADYLRERAEQFSQLKSIKNNLEGLGKGFTQPTKAALEQRISELEAQLSIHSLDYGAKKDLFNELGQAGFFESTRENTRNVLDNIIESTTSFWEMNDILSALYTGGKTDILQNQVEHAREKFLEMCKGRKGNDDEIISTLSKDIKNNGQELVNRLKFKNNAFLSQIPPENFKNILQDINSEQRAELLKHLDHNFVFNTLGYSQSDFNGLSESLNPHQKHAVLKSWGQKGLHASAQLVNNMIGTLKSEHQVDLLTEMGAMAPEKLNGTQKENLLSARINASPTFMQFNTTWTSLKSEAQSNGVFEAKNLGAMTPAQQVEELKVKAKHLSQLKDLENTLKGLDKAYQQPELADLQQQISALEQVSTLNSLNPTQRQNFYKHLAENATGTAERTSMLFNHLFQTNAHHLDEMKLIANSLCAKDARIDILHQQAFQALGILNRLEKTRGTQTTSQQLLENMQQNGKLTVMAEKLSPEQLAKLQTMARSSGKSDHPVGMEIQKAKDKFADSPNIDPEDTESVAALEKLKTIPKYWEKKNLGTLTSTEQALYLKERMDALSQLETIQKQLESGVTTSSPQLAELQKRITQLKEQTSLKGLNSTQKRALCTELAKGNSERTKLVLNHLIESSQSAPSDLANFTKTLAEQDNAMNIFHTQVFQVMEILNQKPQTRQYMGTVLNDMHTQKGTFRTYNSAQHFAYKMPEDKRLKFAQWVQNSNYGHKDELKQIAKDQNWGFFHE